jgi:hypothetical protein
MKVSVLIPAISVAVALAAPAVTFARGGGGPIARVQVRHELVAVEHAGYRPGDGDQTKYPEQVQQAQARIAKSAAGASDYGGVPNGSSVSSSGEAAAPAAQTPGLRPIYSGQ